MEHGWTTDVPFRFFSSQQQTPRAPNAFAVFVKENYGYHRTPGRSHAEVMKELGAKFSAAKISTK